MKKLRACCTSKTLYFKYKKLCPKQMRIKSKTNPHIHYEHFTYTLLAIKNVHNSKRSSLQLPSLCSLNLSEGGLSDHKFMFLF